ncbi:MAG: glycosyltransferase family 2 protein [Cyanobacteria bacterium SIG32]|nr:glycosyltransferase family 2 protein [Cyanobacteria bacterium SIG32]
MPLVSVIIPVYNVEEYLRQALDSLINQTFKDIEIICVDDCSTDGSLKILNEYAQNDDRFVVLKQACNQGQGVARNRALDCARGKYIMFLDPDDWYELDAIEKVYNQISENNNEIVLFGVNNYNESKNEKKEFTVRTEKFESIIDNKHINFSKLDLNWITSCWVWCYAYSAEFIKNNDIKFSSERFAEDLPFFAKAIALSRDASVLKDPLYNYRMAKSTLTINYSDHWEDGFEAKNKAYQMVKDFGGEPLLNAYLVYAINSDIYWFRAFKNQNKKIAKDFYKKLHEKFVNLAKTHNINKIKNEINHEQFSLILKHGNYLSYRFFKFIKKIF